MSHSKEMAVPGLGPWSLGTHGCSLPLIPLTVPLGKAGALGVGADLGAGIFSRDSLAQ